MGVRNLIFFFVALERKRYTDKMTGPYTYKYPHAALTTDCVVFGFDGRSLHVLLIERGIDPCKGSWALPGGFMNIDETLEECAKRELMEETSLTDIYLEQCGAFSRVDRDPRERVVTVAFMALVRKGDYQAVAGDDAARAQWFAESELPPLAFDHAQIIAQARCRLQEKLRTEPIAFRLLDHRFAMTELQTLYEVINQHTYDRRNFAKKMLATGLVCEAIDDELCSPVCCESIMPDDMPNEPSRKPTRKGIEYTFDEVAYEAYTQRADKRKYPFDF